MSDQEDQVHVFVETAERQEIVTEFRKSQAAALRAANLLTQAGYPDQAHKARNVAQAASARVCVLSLIWSQEDEQKAA